ncbi:MAG: hypothetical protein ACI4FO_03520 [Acutalibacteraceae bacterium]
MSFYILSRLFLLAILCAIFGIAYYGIRKKFLKKSNDKINTPVLTEKNNHIGYKKIKNTKKTLVICLGIVLYLMLDIALFSFPIENLVFTFDAPEDVYRYTDGNGQIINTINGQESSVVAAMTNDGSVNIKFIPKSEKGYKIPGAINDILTDRSIKTGFTEFNSGIVQIFKVNNTDDYYISGVLSTEDDNLEVTDNYGNIFYTYSYNSGYEDENDYHCIAYLKDFSEEGYYLLINGEKELVEWR